MYGPRILKLNKRLLACFVIATCLSLICIGGALSKLAPPFSPQPHRPRAVIETCSKRCVNAASHRMIPAALCSAVPEIPFQAPLRERFAGVSSQFESVTLATVAARGPPLAS